MATSLLRHRAPSSRVRVLIIDDERDLLDVYSLYLRTAGMEVHTATDGVTGVSVARALRPEVIVLDIAMPSMDGMQVVEALKASPETESIPVILFTGLPLKDRGRADACVLKPARPVAMLSLIRTLSGRA
jgi:CheY-like chemotaxis protein